jgi:hypothetical protein
MDLNQFQLGFGWSPPWLWRDWNSPINRGPPRAFCPHIEPPSPLPPATVEPLHQSPTRTVATEVIFGARAPPEGAPTPLKSGRTASLPLAVREPFSPPQVSKVGSLHLLDHVGRNRLEIGVPKSEVEPPMLSAMELPLLALFSPVDGEENRLGHWSHDRRPRLEGK